MGILNENLFEDSGLAPGLDITKRGQQGYLRDYENIHYSERFVKPRMHVALVDGPLGMQWMRGGATYYKILKSLIETRAISITGINGKTDVEYHEEVEGNAGQVREVAVKSTIERSVPAYVWPEVAGRTIQRFWENFIYKLIQHPESGVAELIYEPAFIKAGNPIPVGGGYAAGFTTLYYTPTPGLDGILEAELITNMMPKTAGDKVSQRVQQEAMEVPNVEIEFTGIGMRGKNVDKMALKHLTDLSKPGFNAENLKLHLAGISGNIAASHNGAASLLEDNTP